MCNLPLNQILFGDSYALIKQLPDESIDLVITSPPYFRQRDYGGGIGNENALSDYLDSLIEMMRECVRVLKPQGSIVFNLGDKYENSSLLLVPYRFAIKATEDLPLSLVNAVTWVKKNPTPRQFKRRLVSSTEPFFHFVKSNSYFYNPDAFMKPENMPKKVQSKANVGQSYFALIEQSELTPEQKHLAKQELLQVIQEVQSGKLDSFRMKIRGLHSEPFGGQAGGRQIQLEKQGFTIIRIYGNPMKKDVIEMAVESLKNSNHPAIYPVKLVMEFLHLLTTPEAIVLDPFMGSGSTAVACKLLKSNYIGFDLNPEYCKTAEERLKSILPHTSLP
jgi:site-specific DNA-methyltransferase (adenine-specific)